MYASSSYSPVNNNNNKISVQAVPVAYNANANSLYSSSRSQMTPTLTSQYLHHQQQEQLHQERLARARSGDYDVYDHHTGSYPYATPPSYLPYHHTPHYHPPSSTRSTTLPRTSHHMSSSSSSRRSIVLPSTPVVKGCESDYDYDNLRGDISTITWVDGDDATSITGDVAKPSSSPRLFCGTDDYQEAVSFPQRLLCVPEAMMDYHEDHHENDHQTQAYFSCGGSQYIPGELASAGDYLSCGSVVRGVDVTDTESLPSLYSSSVALSEYSEDPTIERLRKLNSRHRSYLQDARKRRMKRRRKAMDPEDSRSTRKEKMQAALHQANKAKETATLQQEQGGGFLWNVFSLGIPDLFA